MTPEQSAQMAQLKQQLADIHWPEPVSAWPPAIGWILLFSAALILLLLMGFLLCRQHRANAYRRQALQHIDSLDMETQQQAATELSQLLRRCLLHLQPLADHSAQGAARHRQLAQFCRRDCPVSQADIEQLEAICYGHSSLEPSSFSELVSHCRTWIGQHQRTPQSNGGQHA